MNAPTTALAGTARPGLEQNPYSYVARQPIFTTDEKVFGYEILFRDGVEDYFREKDSDAASRKALDNSLQMGLQMLCDGKRAFVNCTREVLLKDYVTLFPSTHTVVGVLEIVPPDDLVKAALQRLRQAGYMIALDDFLPDDPRTELVDFADILKVDLQTTTIEDWANLIKRYGPCAAVCWWRESRLVSTLPKPRPPASFTFRGFSSASRS